MDNVVNLEEAQYKYLNLLNDTRVYCICVTNGLAPYEAHFLARRVLEVVDALQAYFEELCLTVVLVPSI